MSGLRFLRPSPLEEGAEDKVGDCRPPRDTRFRPGQSGNPRGRPKRPRTLAARVRRALDEEVEAKENGETRRITKLEAAVKQLMNRAASGEARATRDAIALAAADENRAARPEAPRRPTRDAVVIAELLRRIRSAP